MTHVRTWQLFFDALSLIGSPNRSDRSRRLAKRVPFVAWQMSRPRVSFSAGLTSYLARLQHISTSRRRKKKDTVIVQTNLSTGILGSILRHGELTRDYCIVFSSFGMHLRYFHSIPVTI